METKVFGGGIRTVPIPNLMELQMNAYSQFLQADVHWADRDNIGLESILREIFPIESYDGTISLTYLGYDLGRPRYTIDECRQLKLSYGTPFKIRLRMEKEGESVEEEVFLGELPSMIGGGEFIINGSERVIVSQLHRSPGVDFSEEIHTGDVRLHSARIIPERGSWVEFNVTKKGALTVRIDQSGKFPATMLLRAMNEEYGSSTAILELFYPVETVKVGSLKSIDNLLGEEVEGIKNGRVSAEDIVDAETGEILLPTGDVFTETFLKALFSEDMTAKRGGKNSFKVLPEKYDDLVLKTLKEDNSVDYEDALIKIYQRLRPGNPPQAAKARELFFDKFYNQNKYRLGRVGRFRINRKFGLAIPESEQTIQKEDILESIAYIFKLRDRMGKLDDIDHLGNRRVRTIEELAGEEMRKGFLKLKRTVQERMSMMEPENLTPRSVINSKTISSSVDFFFGRGELSQVVDQTNPLSQLTHERRLSALGPGGLNRKRAGFEVRDVHISHYGRICPIETPEGTNIGLISSLAVFATIDEYGFLITPYFQVKDGKAKIDASSVKFLRADEEENQYLTPADTPVDESGQLLGDLVLARLNGEFIMVEPSKIQLMDVSSKQLIGVSAALIPFLEHDDANRALMGSNMQRQGVPLLQADSPFVGTGIEERVARDSKTVCVTDHDGIVASVDANRIVVTDDGELPEHFLSKPISDHSNGVHVIELRKFMRSNAGTCFNQKPIVAKGQPVKATDIVADGPCTQLGELALGRNILVAFMPWNGYNFEDAILISEKVLKDDIYTSIHVAEFEVTARDTKLGPEEITRDIPNVGEEALKDLDESGIIRIGAEVKPGDVLVGKITPKSETELAPEEKLLRAIFGEKAADVKDTSLTVPSGCHGIVMDVKIQSKADPEKESLTPSGKKRQTKKIREEYRNRSDKLREELTEALSNILLGEKIPLDVSNSESGEIIIPANRKITKTLLRRMAQVYKTVDIAPSPVRNKILEILSVYKEKFGEIEGDQERKLASIEEGDDLTQGIIKNVKVYVTTKRKIQVGDKMAGRHGNKGVVARIVPESDMPFLPDGTPVEICLNPLGVPSRMNVGQVLETHLGWACNKLGFKVATPIFDGISESRIKDYLKEANLPETGKTVLYDGCSGEPFYQKIVVGYMYMLKLNHLVSSKIHARAVGPYSLITQQPLGGKARFGGQRFGEMEVWALEAYGAAYALQEFLTVKSDDVPGRTRMYEAIVKGENTLECGVPESFNVLVKELQALCLDLGMLDENDLPGSAPLLGMRSI